MVCTVSQPASFKRLTLRLIVRSSNPVSKDSFSSVT
nr:MAG TPA: hypothetical protein [Caudoviricetes sp.]